MAELPKFDEPPVIEVALSVQFERLQATPAHFGVYWSECLLADGWGKVTDTGRLDDQKEKFGAEREWSEIGRIALSASYQSPRLQFITANDERMIQVQDSRFVLNWRRRDGEYPSFNVLKPEFEYRLGQFKDFIGRNDLGVFAVNQWEVTYLNQIENGTIWQSVADLGAVSSLMDSPVAIDGQDLEQFNGAWHFTLNENKGRLHVNMHTARRAPDGRDVIVLKLISRGPLSGFDAVAEGLDLGHRHVVRTFAEMTSAEAHAFWKRRE